MRGQPLTQGIWCLHQGKEEMGQSNECIVIETFLYFAVPTKLANLAQTKQGGSGKAPPALAHKAGLHVQETSLSSFQPLKALQG
jgi:hypothetical protein